MSTREQFHGMIGEVQQAFFKLGLSSPIALVISKEDRDKILLSFDKIDMPLYQAPTILDIKLYEPGEIRVHK